MVSNTRLTLNLQYPNIAQVAYAMQGDRLSHAVVADLIDGSTPWAPPAGAYGLITASKPDGTFAVYDTLEDGSPAIVIDGSTVTLYLAEQVLADAGAVKMSVAFFTAAGARLTTFRWTEVVAPEAVLDRVVSENYISILTATMAQAADDLAEAQTIFDQIKAAYGAPLTANTAAAMTDTSRVYVYTGTTTSTLTNGHWYYWDGTAWADGGVYNSTAFETDTTLTVAGAAADAKATGDAVNELKNALNTFAVDTVSAPITLINGNIRSDTGANYSTYSNKRLRCNDYFYIPFGFSIVIPSGFRAYFYYYSGSGYSTFIRPGGVWFTGTVTNTSPYGIYVRVVIAKEDDTDLSPSDVGDVTITTFINTDKTLTLDGKAADAKATGDAMSSINHQVTTIQQSYKSLTLGTQVIQITNGTDLNDITTVGNYRAASISIATSLINSPTRARFRLTVEYLTTTSIILQTIINVYGAQYTRQSEDAGATWSPWIAVEKTCAPLKDDSDATNIILQSFNSNPIIELARGTYIIHSLIVPENYTIRGQGNATILQLNAAYPDDPAIIMSKGSGLQNLKIIGAGTGGEAYFSDGNITSSHGVLVNIAGDGEANRNRINISDVEICGFTGGAITLKDTGVNYDNSCNIVNCYLHNNTVGINIPQKSEFNRVSNVQCGRNFYGCINNGGNNLFSNCGFNGNVHALLMDSTGITSPNDSHGSFVGCNFNHTHAFDDSTSLTAIEIIGMHSCEIFSACHIAYGGISIKNSVGIQFNGCNFMSDVPISVDGGGVTIFTNCIALSSAENPYTPINDPKTKFVDCFYRSGTPYNPVA